MGGIGATDVRTVTGIERLHAYPTAFSFDLRELAVHRNYDADYLISTLMTRERGINPPWEDPVTNAVNAGQLLLEGVEREGIGLLIVCTETGVDSEKPISAWVHRYLRLPSHCRHFEVKCACYGGTAAIRMAQAWVATEGRGRKALVVATDQSLISLGKPWEYVNGAGSVAMLVSDTPALLRFDSVSGIYANEVTDVIRPLPWVETGNSEESLFAYMEGLTGAFDNYIENCERDVDFREAFNFNVYHVPFSGISFRAHKQMHKFYTDFDEAAFKEDYQKRVYPSVVYTSRVGSVYSAGLYLALLSLIDNADDIEEGSRIGLFSYGSGSCAEYFSMVATDRSKHLIGQLDFETCLSRRTPITVEQYERFERDRTDHLQMPSTKKHIAALIASEAGPYASLYKEQYEGSGRLIYLGTDNHVRHYDIA